MKILSIEIVNFMAIAEAKIQLADRGLVLVQGVNKDDTSADSNGAGKSSVADALCWSLYGETARGESGDAVVNKVAGKGCLVRVVLREDDTEWTITRCRKHKVGKNAVMLSTRDLKLGVGGDLTKGTDKLTQIEVEKIVGCSYDVFRASIYSGQEAMPDLPGMTDRNLKTIVEEAAGVTVLERAYDEARSRLGVVKTKQAALQSKVEAAIERVKDAQEAVGQIKGALAAWDQTKKSNITAQEKAAGEAQKTWEARMTQMSAHRKPADISADIIATRKLLAGTNNEITLERSLAHQVSLAERNETQLRAALSTIKTSFEAAKKGIADVDHRVGCPCDECGRPLTDAEIAPTKERLTARALTLKDEHEKTRTQAQVAVNARKSAADALNAHRESMTDTTETSEKLNALNVEQKAHDAAWAQVVQADGEHMAAQNLLKRTIHEENPFVVVLAARDADIIARVDALTDANAQLAEANTELAIAIEVSRVFSPAGVRGAILEEVTPYLNDQTAIYLGLLSDGNIRATWSTLTINAKGEAKEKFAIEVENELGGGSFGLLSGGEKRKVRIAAALALQDLVASRATKKIELWIGDEVDNALDPAGVERLMMILQEKARERGSVFVISHSNLKDWISQVMTVVKEGGVSTIEEENAA